MSALAESVVQREPDALVGPWGPVVLARPQMAATTERYLAQLSVSLRPASVKAASAALRQFCLHVIDEHPEVECFSQVHRGHVESFKVEWPTGRRRETWGLNPTPSASACCACAASSTGSSSGGGRRRRPVPLCSSPMCPPRTNPCHTPSTTRRRRGSCRRPRPRRTEGASSWWSSWPAPEYRAWVNSVSCRTTPWSTAVASGGSDPARQTPHRPLRASAPPSGGAAHGVAEAPRRRRDGAARHQRRPTAQPSHGDEDGERVAKAAGIGQVYPHDCATPSPPRRSTAECAWRPSASCSDTRPSR